MNSFHELKFLHSNASTGVKELSVLESFLFWPGSLFLVLDELDELSHFEGFSRVCSLNKKYPFKYHNFILFHYITNLFCMMIYLFILLPRSHSSRKLRTLLEHYRLLVLLTLHLRHCLQWTFRRNPVYESIAHSSLGSSVVRVRQVPNSFLDDRRKSKINF